MKIKKKDLYWMLEGTFLATILAVIFSNYCILIFGILLTIFSVFVLRLDGEIYKYAYIYLFLFCTIMVLVYYGWEARSGAPYLIGGSDDFKFEVLADLYIEKKWYNFTENHGYTTNTRFYVFTIMILKRLGDMFGGYHTILPRLLNGYIILWSIQVINLLMKDYWEFSVTVRKRTMLLLSVNIYMIYICSFVFRDPMCLLFILLIIYNSKRMRYGDSSNVRIVSLIGLIVLLFVSYYLRSQLLLIGVAVVILSILFDRERGSYKKLIFLAIACVMVLVVDSYTGIVGVFESNQLYTEYQTQSEGLSHTIIGLPIFPLGLIARLTYALIYPFPAYTSLFATSNDYIIDLIFLSAYIYGFFQFVRMPKVINAIKSKRSIEILSYFGLFILLFSFATFTFRHYLFVIPFLILLQAVGEEISKGKLRNDNNRVINCLMMIIYILMMVIYVYIS